jgi:MFS family permease
LLSVVSLGSLFGALRNARRTKISVRNVSLAALGFGVAMTAMAVAPTLPIAFFFGVGLGVTSIAFMTSSTAIVQTEADPSMRGRVLALQAMVFLGSTPIGGPIVGAISQHFGARYALGLGAAGCFVAGFAALTHRATAKPVVAAEAAVTV